MDQLLSLLPIIFSFQTGMLIALGLFNLLQILSTICVMCTASRKIRESDVAVAGFITIVSIILGLMLFVTSEFVSFNLEAIIFLEMWYAIFLFHVTKYSTASCAVMGKIKHPII